MNGIQRQTKVMPRTNNKNADRKGQFGFFGQESTWTNNSSVLLGTYQLWYMK